MPREANETWRIREDLEEMTARRVIFVVLAGCAIFALFTGVPSPGERRAHAEDYAVGSQDVLKISVYEHPELNAEVRVSQDGKISFPLIGELAIKGKTSRKIEELIAKKLAAGYVPNPQVSVFIEQFNAQKVTVIGEVNKPGQYEITGPATVVDSLAMALGLTQNAGRSIILLRKGPLGRYERTTIDADRLFEGKEDSKDVRVKDKDVIYVPKVGFFYIYGEVNRPGVYPVERNLTVRRAISIAGGFTPKAATGRIEITGRLDGKDFTKAAKVDDRVKADDAIMVKESIF